MTNPADEDLTNQLHQQIMNIPCYNGMSDTYKLGHRDARHAAAELVLAQRADDRELLIQARAERDDTPIEPKWLESIGFARRPVDDCVLELAEGVVSVVAWNGNIMWRVHGTPLPQSLYPQTRGQFMAIANRLGIPLPSPSAAAGEAEHG